MARQAIEYIRKLRGGSQSHLMRCDDGYYYVVKFRNNPQGLRILTNEMLAGRLALALGLPVPAPEVVEVDDWLVQHTPELRIDFGSTRQRCASGFQFGSRYPCDPLLTPVYDFLPDALLGSVLNRTAFLGMLVFDKWACNCDSRQAIFYRSGDGPTPVFTAMMIDHGFCFNAADWTFPDAPARGLYARVSVYEDVTGLESFEPYLTRLEHLHEDALDDAASAVPPQWYDGRVEELRSLLAILAKRRSAVRSLIMESRHSSKRPFLNWLL